MSKRAKFFAVSLFLGFLLWLSGFFGVEKRLAIVLSISGIAYVLSAWVLFEDLKGWEWITLLILPVLFTLGSGLFGNLLPTAIPSMFGLNFQIETSLFLGGIVRFLFTVLYVFGVYAVLLTENIFSVASIRTIQLFRAARFVSFWPVAPFMGGLLLTACFYALLGVLEQRLINKTVVVNYLEFLIFNLII